MPLQDKVVSWFVQNFVMPRSQILDKPGFVSMHITGGRNNIYLREVIMPESFFVEVENKIIEKFGEEGKKKLYSAGKKFGYRYTMSGGFPTKKDLNEKNFSEFVYLLVRYTEGTYASEISYELKIENDEIDLKLDNYIICNKSGQGYFLTSGGAAGIWSYLTGNKSIEGVQLECQGNGASKCNLICAPSEILEKRGITQFSELNLENLQFTQKYNTINEFRKVNYAQYSFQDMLRAKIFTHSKGILEKNNKRFFLCEASGVYLIEKELSRIEEAEEIIFEAAFNAGKDLVDGTKQGNNLFATNILSALGWGDVLILKKEGKYVVIASYFPWTEFEKEVTFQTFRGLVSGLLSAKGDKRIIFRNYSSDTIKGFHVVTITE